MKFKITLAIFLLSSLATAFAADTVPSQDQAESVKAGEGGENQTLKQKKAMHLLLGGGLTFGGDTLGTMTYADGGTDSITAGGLLYVYGGLDYRLTETVSLQSSLGYHFDSTKAATNGGATFSRIPLELLWFYHITDAFRMGGGVRIVNGPKVEGTGIASGANVSFNNTIGMVVAGEYMFVPSFGVEVRFVNEKYKKSGWSGSVDGSHVGVLANLYL